jgi:outer membrane protein OmpA-like peptidoglycan-associated protein
VRTGVPASAISENWHGEENPRVPTADGVREPQNRRVEITMWSHPSSGILKTPNFGPELYRD